MLLCEEKEGMPTGNLQTWTVYFLETQIDANLPPDVLRTGIAHVRPERVLFFLFGVKMTERINKSFSEQFCETLPFLFGESCGLCVGFRVCQV